MLTRTMTVAALAAASLSLAAYPAIASGGLGDTNCGANSCTSFVQDGAPAVPKPGPVRSPADPNTVICQSIPVLANDKLPDQIVDLSVPGSDPGPLDAYEEQCTQNGRIVSSKLTFYPHPTASSARALAEKAYKTLDMPRPQVVMSPAAGIPQLVGLPVWLWLKPGSWVPKSSTVSAGAISVTATATPQRVVWSMGDGATVTCAGPGTPYPDQPIGAGVASSPTCGHTFHRTSAAEPRGSFSVMATIVWRVDWKGFGPGGTFPDVESSVSLPMRVVEAAALVTDSH